VSRERIFNLPGVVTALIAVLVVIQLAVDLFPQSVGVWTLVYFSFIPARLAFLVAPNHVLRALADVDGDELAAFLNTAQYSWWTPLSYAFLHANWTHLAINSVMLAAFGAPVARRLGSARFLVFFAVTAIAGAFAHLATHPYDLEPVVGASAAISGAMAAIARFAFARGEALGERLNGQADADEEKPRPQTLARLFEDRRATVFLLSWLAANLVFGLLPQAPGGAGVIAWEAHIGGFLAGLLLFGWFDPKKGAVRR
jgi:membrane associated rhomboid family serine protease